MTNDPGNTDEEVRDAGAPPAVPLTTMQVRRIAEALDGFRTGDVVYVVLQAGGDAPLAARVVVGERELAERAAANLSQATGRPFIVAGPFTTTRDQTMDRDVTLGYAVVVHEPESYPLHRNVGYFGDATGIEEVWLEIKARGGGTPARVKLAPSPTPDVTGIPRSLPDVDAVFLSFAAVDKFLIPYYARLYGAAASAEIRKRLAREAEEERQKFRAPR